MGDLEKMQPGHVNGIFHGQTPLTECCIVACFELLYGELCCFESCGRQCLEKSIGNGLIDLNTAYVQAVHSASTNHILARGVVSGRRGSARVVSVEPTATLPTGSEEALQQCAAFSHGAARLMWLRMLVGINAGASLASPCFRFHIPLIEPDMRISRFRLSETGTAFTHTGESNRANYSYRSATMGSTQLARLAGM
jgi:hypothetical protein